LDGSYLWVPSQIITTSAITVIATVAPPKAASTVSGSLPLVNINTASQEELESLPGIGPALAKQIIAYRTVNGPFKVIEDILDVPGIGPKTFEKIKALITV
jgi:competence protein ComEA